jgi:hypothetical protein
MYRQSHPIFEIDSEAPLLELEKIFSRKEGTLSEEDTLALLSELEELIPQGHYIGIGPDFGVEVLGIGYTEPVARKFYVEFRILCGGKIEQLPIALFLETHRLMAIDMA